MPQTTRQISKNPLPPKLTPRLTSLLTKLCFRKDSSLAKSDILFVFSSQHALSELTRLISNLLSAHITQSIFITGGVPNFTDSALINLPESHLVLQKLSPSLLTSVKVYTEEKSTNTKENVLEGLKVLNFSNYKNISFISKAHAAGRSYLTLRKYCPNSTLFQYTFSGIYPENPLPLTADNWFKNDFFRSRVWGEYLRIKTYSERRDIEYDEIKTLIDEINQ